MSTLESPRPVSGLMDVIRDVFWDYMLPWIRHHWQFVVVMVAIALSAIVIRASVNPPMQVVTVVDPASASKIAGLEADVRRLGDEVRAEEEKIEEFKKEAEQASEIVGEFVEPSFVARYVLTMKRRGTPVKPSYFCSAYTEAYRKGMGSLGIGSWMLGYAHTSAKSIVFGNNAATLLTLWRFDIVINAVGEVAASYKSELELLANYPKLIENFEPSMMPRTETGYPDYHGARDTFTKHYGMGEASDREIADAYCFVSFMARRHEEYGPGSVAAILVVAQEVIDMLYQAKKPAEQVRPVVTNF